MMMPTDQHRIQQPSTRRQLQVSYTIKKTCWAQKPLCYVKVNVVPPYSFPSVGPGANHGVQAVSPRVTLSNPPGRELPLLSAMPAVTFPAW